MTAATSGSAVLLNLEDDYLAPSQACINPVFSSNNKATENNSNSSISNNSNSATPQEQQQSASVGNKDAAAIGSGVAIHKRARGRRRRRPLLAASADPPFSAAAAAASSSADSSSEGTVAKQIIITNDNSGNENKSDLPLAASVAPRSRLRAGPVLQQEPTAPVAPTTINTLSNTKIITASSSDRADNNNNNNNNNNIVKASMADCLACSGCITTAESVLLEQAGHGVQQLLSKLGVAPVGIDNSSSIAAEEEGDIMKNENHRSDKTISNVNTEKKHSAAATMVVVTISAASWADLFRAIDVRFPPPSMLPSSSSSSSSCAATDYSPSQQCRRRRLYHQYQRKLAQRLNRALNGTVRYVLDGNLPQHWSLQAAAVEFCHAYEKKHQQTSSTSSSSSNSNNSWNCSNENRSSIHHHNNNDAIRKEAEKGEKQEPEAEKWERQLMPSQALNSKQSIFLVKQNDSNRGDSGDEPKPKPAQPQQQVVCETPRSFRTNQSLPLLSASCPAMVCLVEKSRHAAVPHLAKTRSPMALAGTFWKALFYRDHCSKNNNSRDYPIDNNNNNSGGNRTTTTISGNSSNTKKSFLHLAIMPCHDKKLEASRKDFVDSSRAGGGDNGWPGGPDVDVVLTTQECLDLLLLTSEATIDNQEDRESSGSSSVDGTAVKKGEDGLTILKRDLENIGSGEDDTVETNDGVRHVHVKHDDTFVQVQNKLTITASKSRTIMPTLITSQAESSDIASAVNTDVGDDPAAAAAAAAALDPASAISANRSNRDEDIFFPLGSGGYADYIFRYAAKYLFGFAVRHGEVPWKPVVAATSDTSNNNLQPRQSARMARKRRRNRDYYHATLYRIDGADNSYSLQLPENTTATPVLHFGIAHGMQTLQRVLEPFDNVTSQQRQNEQQPQQALPFHYIEAMACPTSACLNGGGQVRSQGQQRERPIETKRRVQATQELFQAGTPPAAAAAAAAATASASSFKSQRLPLPTTMQHTTAYHIVPPMQLRSGAVEGVAVDDMQW